MVTVPARLDRPLEGRLRRPGRLGRPRHLGDLDPGLFQLGLGDDDPVRLERERLQPHAGALGGEDAMAVRIPQIEVVDADAQEAADVDGLDPQIALDGVARLVGDVVPELFGTPPGVQPDERHHDCQHDEAEQRESADAGGTRHLAPSRPCRSRPRRRARRLVARLWRMLGHLAGFFSQTRPAAPPVRAGTVDRQRRSQKASPRLTWIAQRNSLMQLASLQWTDTRVGTVSLGESGTVYTSLGLIK